jgi:DNA-binding GntR family transcriptional regulator
MGTSAENVSSQLRATIETDILTGTIAPETRLDEASLAKRFGVSRTPIREALQALAAAGLITIRPRRGATVNAPDFQRLIEMFDLMAEMEALCARQAARRLGPADRTALLGTLEACRAAAEHGDTDSYYYENERFHQAIYAASRNGFVAEQALALQKRLASYRRLQLRVRNRMVSSFAEHEAIVAAILAGDEDLAAQRLRGHVVVQSERFADLLAGLNAQGAAA